VGVGRVQVERSRSIGREVLDLVHLASALSSSRMSSRGSLPLCFRASRPSSPPSASRSSGSRRAERPRRPASGDPRTVAGAMLRVAGVPQHSPMLASGRSLWPSDAHSHNFTRVLRPLQTRPVSRPFPMELGGLEPPTSWVRSSHAPTCGRGYLQRFLNDVWNAATSPATVCSRFCGASGASKANTSRRLEAKHASNQPVAPPW